MLPLSPTPKEKKILNYTTDTYHVQKGEGHPRYRWPDDVSLEIWNTTRKDAGVYAVECSNGEGVGQTSIRLDVLCKERCTFTHAVMP